VTTLLKGGTLVTPSGERRADVLISDGRIARVDESMAPASGEVIDVTGLHVFPGFIDPHVHARDPGQTEKEDFGHLTRAAAVGGVTTVLVMPNAVPPVTDRASFDSRASHHERTGHVDFGLWSLVLGREGVTDLADARSAGIVAAKLFWGYSFDRRTQTLRYSGLDADPGEILPAASAGDVWQLFQAAEAAGVMIGVHCEDHAIVTTATRLYGPARGPGDLLRTRPPEAESIAVAAIIELSRASGARAHIMHTSSARSVSLVRRAQAEGVAVSAETCPHYLTLEPTTDKGRGSNLKVYPPVRGVQDAEALWGGVVDGTIESLSSDHAPHARFDRQGPYEQQPAGIAGTETMVQVLLDAARRRSIPLTVLSERLSEGTARVFGLHPRKGRLAEGADADLTVVDLERQWQISESALHSKDQVSPWDGVRGIGAPVMTIVRGRIVARDGRPVGEPSGRLVRPSESRSLPEP
jgi:allantoinase